MALLYFIGGIMDRELEFLDLLSIVSFALQLSWLEQANREASNNEILERVAQLNTKVDLIMEHLDIPKA